MDSRFTQGQSSTSSNARFTQGVLSTPYDTTFSDTEGESSPSYYTPGESFTFSDTKGESSPSYDTPGKSFTFSNTEGESSTSSKFFYHVFLSFSGEDTRKKFVGHLENRLCQVGFQIFKDDKSVRKGDVISMALEKGIENSRISIVVLSTNYASSRWCLDELVKILECKEKLKQRVMPIFYDVEPTEVRKQTGKFGDGFAKLKEQFGDQSMEKWKAALNEVANLSGSELRVLANGCESEFIGIIVQDVKKEVSQTPLDVAFHPVGVDSRAKVIESFLQNGQHEDEVRMVGMHGVGGIGKTTLAKEMFNRLSQPVNFDGSCFLSNVHSEGKTNDGLGNLQEKLLNTLLKTEDVKVNNVDDGITKIKTRLGSKKVLLVLDDVDHIDQLNVLARERIWFGSGSLVIITTRNKQVLDRFGEKDLRYEAKLLNKDDAMSLFCKHAFDNPSPPQNYVNLAQDIIKYSGRLPLALVTLGSHLRGRSIEEWKSEFKKLKAIPHSDIQNILKISFDGLDGDTQRVFLDIACAFHAILEDKVTKILNACDFHTQSEVATLVQKHLLQREETKYSHGNELVLVMHDLVRDMGREIVRKESLPHPGKRSRLFNLKEVRDVLQGNKGTKKVEVLIVELYGNKDDPSVSTEAFKKMENLRVLIIDYLCVSGDFRLFPKQLKYLSWQGCPLERIPSNFPAANLVFLNLEFSAIREFDLNLQCCPKLKELNLSFCGKLRKIPKFNGAESLETLLLDCCFSLTEIDQSICQLKSLQVLDIAGCYEIQTLPVDLGDVQSLRSLRATSIGSLSSIPESVETLEVQYEWQQFIPGADIHVDIGSLSSLIYLDLSGSCFHHLPFDFSKLRFLKDLRLNGCWILQTLPSLSNLENLETLQLAFCEALVDITGLDNLPSIKRIDMTGCRSLLNPFNEGFFRNYPHKGFQIILHCNEIPDWCSTQVAAPFICLILPRHDKEYKFLGMVLWLVCDFPASYTPRSFFVSVSNRESVIKGPKMPTSNASRTIGQTSFVYYISYLNRPFDGQMIKGGEMITVHREDNRFFLKDPLHKIGIHLLFLDQHGNVTSLPADVDHSYSPFPEECSAGHKRAKIDWTLPEDVDDSYSPFPEECSAGHKRAKFDLNL